MEVLTAGSLGPKYADPQQMRTLICFTSRSLEDVSPLPFGAMIANTATSKILLKAINAVRTEYDPSCHAEHRALKATIENTSRHCCLTYVSAKELTHRSEMHCGVEGPIMRDECYAFLAHPKVLRAFDHWNSK